MDPYRPSGTHHNAHAHAYAHAHAHAHAHAAPPPPPSTVDVRRGPPPPPPPAYQHQQPPAPQYQQPPAPASIAPQYAPPSGPSLPPIQQHPHPHPVYGPPGSAPEQQSLPPFRHPSHPVHDPRDAQEHYPYAPHPRSGHATPAPVNRTYSHDSAHQRTPTTPAQPGPYPSAPAPEAAPQQPPPPQHMDHGPLPGYPPTNGVPHHGLPLPGPPAPPPQHHEQHPQQYMTPVMENNHAAAYPQPQPPPPMYAQHSYGPMSASQFSVQARKKQMRATQACEQCRQRKQKCDEGSPCSFCKENNLTCAYRDTPPAKTDKNMEKVLGYLEALSSKMDNFDHRLRRMERAPASLSSPADGDLVEDAATGAEPTRSPQEEPQFPTKKTTEHRTAPHKLLLLWPSVSSLLQDAQVLADDGYAMAAEDRGILRLYTRGEGIDEYDGTQPGGPASPARSEGSSEDAVQNVSTPPEGIWGTGFPQTPVSDSRRSEPYSWGGLKPDGTLDLDKATIDELYNSYIRHIHIMHPFLDKSRLRTLFDNFIKRYTGQNKLAQPWAVNLSSDGPPPAKRQRSNGGGANSMATSVATERSPGNAIVYLVLALGKICMHDQPLPSVVPDNRLNANSVVLHQQGGNQGLSGSSPISAAMKASPEFMSPKSTPTTQPTPPAESRLLSASRSRRSSLDGLYPPGVRNLDVIPGLAYYAKAAEILGDQGDGNDLVHAQMFLLAGLYKGQLARVKESMSWLTMAGRAVRSLLDRYKLYNKEYWAATGDIRKRFEEGMLQIKDKRQNLIVLASWTCLQLESDILAELPLPDSGIREMEDQLLMPLKIPEEEAYDGFDADGRHAHDDQILHFYTFQMYLRKRLNKVHREMYGPDCMNQSLDQVRDTLREHENILNGWRAQLPIGLSWDDQDPPANDILNARLRAKYWGARYVVNRPFLDYALHIMPHISERKRVREVARDVHGNPREKADIHLFEAIEGFGESEIWNASMRCIEAAMQSTVALDGVPDRLIMTNIHGTAHAQFGNMLVLSATWHNKWLKKLVPRERFQALLERTISFLRRLTPISPTCKFDCAILEGIHKKLFEVPSDQKHIYRNEGIAEPMSASNSFNAST